MLGPKFLLPKPQFHHQHDGRDNVNDIRPTSSRACCEVEMGKKPNHEALQVFVPMTALSGCDPGKRHALVKGRRVKGVKTDGLQNNEWVPGVGLHSAPSLTVRCPWGKLGPLLCVCFLICKMGITIFPLGNAMRKTKFPDFLEREGKVGVSSSGGTAGERLPWEEKSDGRGQSWPLLVECVLHTLPGLLRCYF